MKSVGISFRTLTACLAAFIFPERHDDLFGGGAPLKTRVSSTPRIRGACPCRGHSEWGHQGNARDLWPAWKKTSCRLVDAVADAYFRGRFLKAVAERCDVVQCSKTDYVVRDRQ